MEHIERDPPARLGPDLHGAFEQCVMWFMSEHALANWNLGSTVEELLSRPDAKNYGLPTRSAVSAAMRISDSSPER